MLAEINISGVYVSTAVSLHLQINIHMCRINIQKMLLARTYFHEILIDTYKQDWLPTFMLAYGAYMSHAEQLNIYI